MLDLPKGSRRYMRIARQLAKQISEGQYAAGTRLPPERDLAHSLSVSRTTVREALLALEIMRFIEIRVGAGVFVLDHSERGAPVFPDVEGASPTDVLAARRLIEGETAALAAATSQPELVRRLQEEVDEMRDMIEEIPAFDAADTRFHEIIAEAAGNDLFATFVSTLWRMRESSMWERWYDQTRSTQNRVRSIQDHEAILRAIRRGRPDAARTAMQFHLDVLTDRFYQLEI